MIDTEVVDANINRMRQLAERLKQLAGKIKELGDDISSNPSRQETQELIETRLSLIEEKHQTFDELERLKSETTKLIQGMDPDLMLDRVLELVAIYSSLLIPFIRTDPHLEN
jgi:TolA-binding protein